MVRANKNLSTNFAANIGIACHNTYSFMDSTRQQKISRQLQKDLAEYFQRSASEYGHKFVSVTVVRVSPDLSYARVYISIFPNEGAPEVLEAIQVNAPEIRHYVAQKVRHQMRKMPELRFFIDDSLDYADNIDNLLHP